MTSKQKNWIVAVAVLIILGLFFYLGYKAWPKWNPTVTVSDTIYVHDTTYHNIVDSFPYYIVKRDTIIYFDTVFKDVDTAAILKDHFALHVYSRTWEDTLLKVNLRDTVTRNGFLHSDFSYNILRPQQVIYSVINNYSYSRYVYAGISLNMPDFKYSDLSLFYAFSEGYIGVGYLPLKNGLSIKGGLRIAKFGKK